MKDPVEDTGERTGVPGAVGDRREGTSGASDLRSDTEGFESRIQHIDSVINEMKHASSLDRLESLRVKLLGKNGLINKAFQDTPEDDPTRKEKSKVINEKKELSKDTHSRMKVELESKKIELYMEENAVDSSLFHPGNLCSRGHPVLRMRDIIVDYFTNLNFSLEEGPLIEDDFHNFEALNLPRHHPARDMQDTFYFADGMLMRTHTSPVQIRIMENSSPPIRIICAGTTFRRDYDMTHTPMFHQCEGLVVEEKGKVSFANLKSLLEGFVQHIFPRKSVRFRSSFFPFTEPSAEVDIGCVFCNGDGCSVCSHKGWLEILGCGMVHDNVFKAVGYEDASGYAFGLGIERLAMLKWGLSDLRSLYELDMRLMERF